MPTLLRTQLAKAAGVGAESLRFYERKGLLPQPKRAPSGYRLYPPEAVTRLRFIRNAQEIGFSLTEVASLLSLRAKPGVTCAMIRRKVEAKIVDMDRKLAAMQEIREALVRMKASCQSRLPVSECPILENLENKPKGEKP